MSLPSRHLEAAKWGATLIASLITMLALVDLSVLDQQIPEWVYAALGGIGTSYLLAVGGSAAARHYGAQEPSGGRDPTPGSQGEG